MELQMFSNALKIWNIWDKKILYTHIIKTDEITILSLFVSCCKENGNCHDSLLRCHGNARKICFKFATPIKHHEWNRCTSKTFICPACIRFRVAKQPKQYLLHWLLKVGREDVTATQKKEDVVNKKICHEATETMGNANFIIFLEICGHKFDFFEVDGNGWWLMAWLVPIEFFALMFGSDYGALKMQT